MRPIMSCSAGRRRAGGIGVRAICVVAKSAQPEKKIIETRPHLALARSRQQLGKGRLATYRIRPTALLEARPSVCRGGQPAQRSGRERGGRLGRTATRWVREARKGRKAEDGAMARQTPRLPYRCAGRPTVPLLLRVSLEERSGCLHRTVGGAKATRLEQQGTRRMGCPTKERKCAPREV